MHHPAEATPLAGQFEAFALVCGTRYARICRAVSDDPELVALAELSPPEQRRPNLLLAAVHDLLLAGAEHPLADHYPTVLEWRRDGAGADLRVARVAAEDDPDLEAEFADFCRAHRAELALLLTTRATQTNEVGRSSALLPALATVAARVTGPMALVDLGAAAGLNLLFDRYRYDFGSAGAAGPADSAVDLPCRLRTGTLPWIDPAGGRRRDPVADLASRLAGRRGVDQRPLDPADPDDARWLLACQWPDDLVRFRRLRAALTVADGATDGLGRPAAPVVAGDIVDDLGDLAGSFEPGASLCLLTTWVAAYLAPADQAALLDAVRRLGRDRPVHWVVAEQPVEVPALPLGTAPDEHADPRATAVALVTVDNHGERVERLADMHPHGSWLRWYGGGETRPG